MAITDFLQAGAAWLNTARKRVAVQSTVVKTEDGNFTRSATVVAAAQIVNPGEFKSIHDITLFLYDRAECVDIDFKRGVTIIWQDEIYDVVIDKKIQNAFNEQFKYDRVVPTKLVK